jgi:hypothetical protein
MQRTINKVHAAMVSGKIIDASALWVLRPGFEEIQRFLLACGWNEPLLMRMLNWNPSRPRPSLKWERSGV